MALALSESADLLRRMGPALALLAPNLRRLTLLRVIEVSRRELARMTGGQHANRLAEGLTWLDGVAAQLRRDLVDDTMQLQTQAAVSRDWAAQVAIETARCRARLLLVGAPRHVCRGRVG